MINQSASVTKTSATMEQITVNINKLKGHVDRQSTSVARSSSAIEEMLANIQSVTRTLIKNANNVRELIESSELVVQLYPTVFTMPFLCFPVFTLQKNRPVERDAEKRDKLFKKQLKLFMESINQVFEHHKKNR